MAPLRVLTFNWHEAYVCLLARTGHAFTVVDKHKGGHAGWLRGTRPVPANVDLLPIGSEGMVREEALRGAFDIAVCHNLRDLADLKDVPIPKIVVFHNMLSTEIALTALAGQQAPEKKTYIGQYLSLWDEKTRAVFISEKKRADALGIEGRVILPGIDLDEYGGYRGETPRVLRVGNFFTGRDIMLGHSDALAVLRGLPVTVLGINSDIPGARLSSSWDDLREHYRSHRVYLNTTIDRFEDGYNLSMLEAMATGMPVVATLNRTSPVENGVNGFISDDAEVVHGRLRDLLSDQALAKRLGRKARETVAEKFPIGRFVESWNETFAAVVSARASSPSPSPLPDGERDKTFVEATAKSPLVPPLTKGGRGGFSQKGEGGGSLKGGEFDPGPGAAPRKRVLLSYCANPQTAAAYLERAFREDCDVVTYGPDIVNFGSVEQGLSEPIWKTWDLGAVKDRVVPHDITYQGPDLRSVLERLPSGWVPDLFLWVDTGIYFDLDGIEDLPFATAAYFIDTHLYREKHIRLARRFDHVFLAQRAYIPEFQKAGCERVEWLPLACDPKIHAKADVPKRHDIGFVGSLTPNNRGRLALIERLKCQFPVHVERCFLEDMARVYCQSRIVFNQCVKNDLNMRVFEALACGSLLLTDEADGLADFFEDRKHLVVYRNEKDLIDLARHYLDHPEEREAIAAAGRAEVLARHTYGHRAERLMSIVAGRSPVPSVAADRSNAAGVIDACRRNVPSALPHPPNKEPSYYGCERSDLLPLIPEEAGSILDVGCGEGALGVSLLRRGAKRVVGIEREPRAAAIARSRLTDVIEGDVESLVLPFEDGSFDCIVCADVLEHLVDPWTTLGRLSRLLRPGGTLVASIPNVRNIEVLARLVEGRWTYERFGILDEGHLRFFAKADIEDMFRKAGFTVQFAGHSVCPLFLQVKDRPFDGTIQLGRLRIEGLSPEEWRGFFVVQYLLQATRSAPLVGNATGIPAPEMTRAGRPGPPRENPRIAFFCDHTAGTGGGERYLLTMADTLSRRYDVDLFVRDERLLPNAKHVREALGIEWRPDRVRGKVLGDLAEIEPYDLFINASHFQIHPPVARRNLLFTFFPQYGRPDLARRYDDVLTISRFCQEWVRRNWGMGSRLLYPCVEDPRLTPGGKTDRIVSVGRFFEAKDGNNKNHRTMIEAFRRICDAGFGGWELVLAGATDPNQTAYVDELRRLSAGYPIRILTDVPYEELRDVYRAARIYWHAAGLGAGSPSGMEHFGITIVEAMRAGAVPFVFAGGGPAEIVSHGESGFLFKDSDDLVLLTAGLIRDHSRMDEMAKEALAASRRFGREAFDLGLMEAVEGVLSPGRLQEAVSLARRGRDAEAASMLEELADAPDAGLDLFLELGDARYRKGRREMAQAMWKRAFEVEPDHALASCLRELTARIDEQRRERGRIVSGALFDRAYFEEGRGSGVSEYERYTATWAEGHAKTLWDVFRPGTCLEIGCAKGDMVASLRRMGVRAFGTDVSAYSVGQAPGEAAPYLHVGSAAALPFADASFDLVAGIEVLEHVPEERVAETLTEIRRVCRGAVFLTVANTTATQPHDFFKDLSHVTMKPLGWWQERMREAGFDLVDGELPIGEFLGHQLVARVVPPAAAGETPAESSADDPVKALCAEAAEALKRGDADGARRLFVRAASEGGHTAEPYLGLGAVAIHESSYDEARQSYEKALELAAEDPRPLFGLGLAHWGGGEKETALECFVRAASRDADNPALVYHLVQAAHAAGKLETAVEPLERYLGLHPADSDLLLSYAGVCARLGRRSDAEEALSRLKLVAPDQDGLNDLEKTLEETAECRA